MSEIFEGVWIKLAWLLPQRLVYWAGVRLIAGASMHPTLSGTTVPAITGCEALKTWEEAHS
jgi:hypothetical protein